MEKASNLLWWSASVHARPAPSPGLGSSARTPSPHNPTLPPYPTPPPVPKPTFPPSPTPPPTPNATPPPHQPPVDPHSGPKQETPPESGSSGGLSGGQKAGIVIGVFAAAGAGWVGWRIYKKRRGNIRRARFGYQARSDMQL
nr:cyclin-dependent kinase inhibitor 1C-like [Ipomoea batatas]